VITPEVVQHYDAATAPRGFFKHVGKVVGYPGLVWRSWDLVWNFFRRELLGRFRGSIGGVFWVLVQPVFQFVIYFAVFGILFAPKDDLEKYGLDPVFAVYLFAGILLFGSMMEGTNGSLRSVLTSGNLVKKVAFPSELLPLTPILVSATIYTVGCTVLVLVGLATGYVHLGWHTLAWPLLLACYIVFATGLGMVLATAQVFARDVSHLYGILGTAWFFSSPVFWRINMVQEKAQNFPWVIDLLVLNPAFCLLLAQRQVFGIGVVEDRSLREFINYPIGLPGNLAISVTWAVVMFVVGYGFFVSRSHKFADLV